MDMDLVRAQGLALSLIGSLLERGGVIESGEFSRLLGLLAAVTHETDERQGDILAMWASLGMELASAD